MSGVTEHPWFGILLTVFVWGLAQRLRARSGTTLLDPVLLSVSVIVGALLLLDIPYAHYERGGQVISFLLGPAVVALAVPFYRHVSKVRRNLVAVVAGVSVGSVVGIVSASGLVYVLGGTRSSVLSIAPKSVTTPIALEVSHILGGTPPLTIAIVVLTGILGGMVGPELVRLIGVKNPLAEGLAIGTAAHGIGTARALAEGEPQGAMSSVGMTLNGLLTAALLPILARYFFAW